jgi:uncharacterized membrane protein
MPPTDKARSALPARLARLAQRRLRLLIAITIGLLVAFWLPPDWLVMTRVLIGWNVGAALYLVAAYEVIARSDMAQLRQRAAAEDEGRFAILILTVAAALFSLGAILYELGAVPGGPTRNPRHLLLAAVTIFLSWGLVHTIFALHYAHEYHSERGKRAGGLGFPGSGEPDYWDFVYFSFVIGMTCQVSDVAITSKAIRRTATAHGVVSFVFNVALLALIVNIAGSAL